MGEYAFQSEVELKSMGEYKAVPKMYGIKTNMKEETCYE